MKSFIEPWEDAIKKDLNTAFHKDCEDKIPKELFRQKHLTVLIWLPYSIYLRIWNKKTDEEMKREMYKLFIDNGENRK